MLDPANPNALPVHTFELYQKAPLQARAVECVLHGLDVAWKTHEVAPPAPRTTVEPNVPATNTCEPLLAHASRSALFVGWEYGWS